MKDHSKNSGSNLIPPDWQLKSFDDLFVFSGGFSASRDQLSEFGHCYLHYGDIHGSNKSWIDTSIDQQDIPKLDIPLKRISNASLLKDGDVVFVDASEDDDGTSKHIVVVNKSNLPFISGLHTIVAKSKTNELSHEYRRYCFQSYSIRQQFLFYAVGTKVSGISKSNIRNILIAIPPINQQHRISQVLINIDALLAKLDKTIAKKRDMKQAVKQQLLTGKTRLPGFKEEWVTKRLDEVAEIRSGGTPSTSQPSFWDGNISWCTPTDITALKGSKYLCETSRTITEIGLTESSAELIPAQSVLMTSRATIGECAINAIPMATNQGFKNFIPFDTTDVDFLYYLIGLQKHGLIALCVGSTFLEIGKTQLAAYEVRLPSSKVEQTAIADALSEIDGELALLVVRLKKTRDLKQAMMQELLSGKTRLIDKELNNA